MKQRIISAIIALIILVPFFIIGGFPYAVAIYILSVLGLKEFLTIKGSKKQVPLFISYICYIALTLIIFSSISIDPKIFMIDFRIISGLFLLLLMPTILYQDSNVYSINDAFYLIGGVFFIGVSFLLLILIRNISLNYIIYLFIITIASDVFAYLGGSLIGKHKLLPRISPAKTWEGSFIGLMMSTILSTMFFQTVISSTIPLLLILLISCFLSIISQFGDLCFSAIKSYYKKKDFSHIMPGHGGILDRFDSILFTVIAFTFFITLL